MLDENENIDFFKEGNKQKRLKIIENYHKSCITIEAGFEVDQQSFEDFILSKQYPFYDDNENLVEVLIRYCIFYLEEINYDLKLNGLKLLNHLLNNITSSKLNHNMRSNLIYDTLERYLNNKESNKFLDTITETMLQFLNIIESKYSKSEHLFKKHSLVLDSLLNNCYMSTSNFIKCIYLRHIPLYIKQMDYYSTRHIEKILTITFDFVDQNNLESVHTGLFNLEQQEQLLIDSLNLLESLMKTCPLRMHQHGRRIINNLIKMLYLYSLSDNKLKIDKDFPAIIQRIINLLKSLFEIDRVKEKFYEEFVSLKSNKQLNETFIKLIENI